MAWDTVGHSIERDVTKAVAVIATGLVVFGAVLAWTFDALWRRHRR